MREQQFGPKRCRETRKPLHTDCKDVTFFVCKTCGTLFTYTSDKKLTNTVVTCCQQALVPEVPIAPQEAGLIDYKIVGGYNDNAIQIFWKPTITPIWCYLKTFSGGMLKYVQPKKKPPLTYALADLDAFAYCDANPCIECTFRCKRGFEIFVYTDQQQLIAIPLDRMNPYWQSQ